MGYETLTLLQGNVTLAQTITAIGGLVVFAVAAYLLYVITMAYKKFFDATEKRNAAKLAYCEMVYAFKCGIIKQTADEEGIELIYVKPEEKTLIQAIKDDVRKDISNA